MLEHRHFFEKIIIFVIRLQLINENCHHSKNTYLFFNTILYGVGGVDEVQYLICILRKVLKGAYPLKKYF